MRWQHVVPVGVVLVLMAVMGYGLTRHPSQLPSALIGDPVPEFKLPTLSPQQPKLTEAAFEGQVAVINVWASWCVACRTEQAVLAELAMRTGVPVVGINYKDTRQDARRWLQRFGNPYATVIVDKHGQFGFDLGVSGVPETFIVDANGIIRHKVVGPITPKLMNTTLVPLLQRLKQAA